MKLKSHSALKKRIWRSGGGKFLHRHSGTSHNNTTKSKRQKRRLHVPAQLSPAVERRLKRIMPYQ